MARMKRDPAQFSALLERHARLGLQLPKENDFDVDDADEVARVKLILAEMSEVQSEINALMGIQ